jgi:hypothetical protein
MSQNNPRLSQWQTRHQQAMSAVKAAEAAGNPQAVQQAYEELSRVNIAKPDGQAIGKGTAGRPAVPARPAQSPSSTRSLRGVLSTVNETLKGANRKPQ